MAAAGFPINPTTIFAGTWGNGIHRSIDGGSNWQRVAFNSNYRFVSGNSRMPAADENDVRALILSPSYASDGTIFAGTFGQGLLRSTDGGTTWVQIAPSTAQGQALDPFIRSLGLRPDYSGGNASTQLVLGGTRGGGIIRSASNGDAGTWEAINGSLNGDALSIRSIAVSPSFITDNTTFIGTDGGIFKSGNVNSANRLQVGWTGTGDEGPGSPIILSVAEGQSGAGQLPPPPGDDFQKNGLAGIFDQIGQGVTAKVLNIVTAVTLSPNYNDQSTTTGGANTTLFAAVWGSGIYRSADKGATWKSLTRDNPIYGSALDLTRSLVLSPFYGNGADQTIYAGTFDRGIWVSKDNGETWTQNATGTLPWIDQRDVASLAVAPSTTTGKAYEYSVYAGTAGRGVYFYLDPEDQRTPRAYFPSLLRSRAD